jgi:hypothetical protein
VYYFDEAFSLTEPDIPAASTLVHFLRRLADYTLDFDPWADWDSVVASDPDIAFLTRATISLDELLSGKE